MDVDGFKSEPFLPVVQPIRANGNQLHMRSFVGMAFRRADPPWPGLTA